jgi:hypothetical protein
MKFSKVETYENWCNIDRLNDKEFVNGEAVEVQWPDGTTTTEKIVYDKDSKVLNDAGEDYLARDYKAFIKADVRGSKVKVPLRKSDILLRRLG